jgi:hypothetical protein
VSEVSLGNTAQSIVVRCRLVLQPGAPDAPRSPELCNNVRNNEHAREYLCFETNPSVGVLAYLAAILLW